MSDYTIKRAASEFGVTYKTVYRLIELGELEAYRVGTGTQRRPIRITAASVAAFKLRNRVQPQEASGVEEDEECVEQVAC